ncbi:MAG: 50S ribosomal protein L11 methyltransferase, partial [Bdellovibrionales bacterium]|nr:50S ribosomal protein L11 methyltransferase [Bdellovibrionales bacterium]
EFELISDVWVVPTWRPTPEKAQKVLRIDPGMAFGTGTHETTQIASLGLQKIFSKNVLESVLDVGTGTGVLAMLAALLGASNIVGLELDVEARRVARENIELNKMKNVHIFDHQIEREKNKYELVIANIIDGVLIDIQNDLKKCLTDSGTLLLTGVLSEREHLFLKEFQLPKGYGWVERIAKGEWLGFIGAKQ